MVFDALQAQFKTRHPDSEYVFSLRSGKPIDNQNFLNRVWAPLRHWGWAPQGLPDAAYGGNAGLLPRSAGMDATVGSNRNAVSCLQPVCANLTRRDNSAMGGLLKRHISLAPVTGNVT